MPHTHAFPFPASREGALARWRDFLPEAPRYARLRNHVLPGHPHVSRMSPAVRTRLVGEQELLDSLLAAHPLARVEKLAQEIVWRAYWKSWLALHPGVWTDYRDWLRRWSSQPEAAVARRAEAVADGRSGVAVMDGFARELTETGYLHNHARMWFASFWVHVEGLPWQLGADFFYRHLLDADPASNTLSWRWVAGLHTRGKTYLVRRSNLERYCDPMLLADSRGLERLEDGAIPARIPADRADTSLRPLATLPVAPGPLPARCGLWLHEDDLSPETGPLAAVPFQAVAALAPDGQSAACGAWRRAALGDGLQRAAGHYACPVRLLDAPGAGSAAALAGWAKEQGLQSVLTLAPFTGPLEDALPAVRAALDAEGVALQAVRRPGDAARLGLGRRGFFDFWRRVAPTLVPR